MERNIIKIDEAGLRDDLKGLIRDSVEETLNAMLDGGAKRYLNMRHLYELGKENELKREIKGNVA